MPTVHPARASALIAAMVPRRSALPTMIALMQTTALVRNQRPGRPHPNVLFHATVVLNQEQIHSHVQRGRTIEDPLGSRPSGGSYPLKGYFSFPMSYTGWGCREGAERS